MEKPAQSQRLRARSQNCATLNSEKERLLCYFVKRFHFRNPTFSNNANNKVHKFIDENTFIIQILLHVSAFRPPPGKPLPHLKVLQHISYSVCHGKQYFFFLLYVNIIILQHLIWSLCLKHYFLDRTCSIILQDNFLTLCIRKV